MTPVPLRPAARARETARALRRTAESLWISDRPEEAADALAYREGLLARAQAAEDEARRWESQ